MQRICFAFNVHFLPMNSHIQKAYYSATFVGMQFVESYAYGSMLIFALMRKKREDYNFPEKDTTDIFLTVNRQ